MKYLTKAGVNFLNEMGPEAIEYRRLKSGEGSGGQIDYDHLDKIYRAIPQSQERRTARRGQYRQYRYKGGFSKDVAKEGESPRVVRKLTRLGRQAT